MRLLFICVFVALANSSLLTRFEEWVSNFKIKFESHEHYANVLDKWINNDKFIDETNAKNLTYALGHNQFSGMDSNDFSKYVQEPTIARSTYQLEPSVVVKDTVSGNVDFHVTYPEVLQKISYLGGKVNNPSGLWSNEFYSFDPHVNLDAFINFGQYYWLPSGPQAVDVFSGAADLERTFYIYPNNGTQVYNISGYGNGTKTKDQLYSAH
jgi:hypothetical protein